MPVQRKKIPSCWLACAAPEIGAELSELGPGRRIRVLAWLPGPDSSAACSDDGSKLFYTVLDGAH